MLSSVLTHFDNVPVGQNCIKKIYSIELQRGYRSMLLSVLTHIDNVPVGQHPYIIRLLKRLFNTRPPRASVLTQSIRYASKSTFWAIEIGFLKIFDLQHCFSCSHYNFPKMLSYPNTEVGRSSCYSDEHRSDFRETRFIETVSNEPLWYLGVCTSF